MSIDVMVVEIPVLPGAGYTSTGALRGRIPGPVWHVVAVLPPHAVSDRLKIAIDTADNTSLADILASLITSLKVAPDPRSGHNEG
jgi:hypothetical protein